MVRTLGILLARNKQEQKRGGEDVDEDEDKDQEKEEEEEEEEEEDYMTMYFPSVPTSRIPETSLQRHVRLEKEGETRGRMKSKEELVAEEKERREERLSKSLLEDPSMRNSKAFRMMKKMGFNAAGSSSGDSRTKAASYVAIGDKKTGSDKTKESVSEGGGVRQDGDGSGDGDTARTKPSLQRFVEPIRIHVKEDRAGIGHAAAQKRKLAEHILSSTQAHPKKPRPDEGEFRDRVRREREAARNETLVHAAQKVGERLHAEATLVDEVSETSSRPLKSVPLLWRGLAREREERERERRMERELDASLSHRLPQFHDEGEYDKDDRYALGKNAVAYDPAEDLDQEDKELDEFNGLDPADRLARLVAFLRDQYMYCFWCKYGYDDRTMEGCPGLTEEEHD